MSWVKIVIVYGFPLLATFIEEIHTFSDSKRSPRSAHTCSRFYPLPFDLTLGTFQLLVVTANEVQDQLMVVHVLYPLPFDLT